MKEITNPHEALPEQKHAKLLIVEDEAIFRRELSGFLEEEGYDVHAVESGEEALALLQKEEWHIVLLDLALPGMSGIEVLRQISTHSIEAIVLVMTAFASLDTAIEALRLGAFDYLKKPIRFEELLIRLEKLDRYRQVVHENQALKRTLNQEHRSKELIGAGPGMQKVFEHIHLLKATDTNVLITGESGVGKELVARAIHHKGPNRQKPWIPLNVSAIPESMLENQLFGHKKGAFTGADSAQQGVFQAARGGTVFLDEIGELPLALQPRLLRALEQKEIFPLGAEAPISVQFRLVAATNRDLEAMVEEGLFRQDLYYRLNVFRIEVPPLRERREDLPLLIQSFVEHFSTTLKKPVLGLKPDAMQALLKAPWPGNIRELRNVIERAIILSQEAWLGTELLPATFQQELPSSLLLRDIVWKAEQEHIQMILQLTNGNREKAAHMMGIGAATLYRRLEKMDDPKHD